MLMNSELERCKTAKPDTNVSRIEEENNRCFERINSITIRATRV
jgi:hypothetical protein